MNMMSKGKHGHKFHNWSHTFSCQPELYFEPTTVDELREILKQATANKKKVKVVGEGLSPSDIACTNDYMVSMKRFDKVLDVDVQKRTVTAEAGVTVMSLNDVLGRNGLAFSLLPSVFGQSLAGIIATGSHGTGARFGSFSSFVLRISLMTADGSIISCSMEENPQLFKAACCHLGLLGIVLSVQIQCEPAFRLLERKTPTSLSDVIQTLDKRMKFSEHFKFFWFPHTNSVVSITIDRTERPVKDDSSWIRNTLIGYYLLEFCMFLSVLFPILVPPINKLFFSLCYSQRYEKVDRSDKVFFLECLFKQYVTEWAVPVKSVPSMLTRMEEWLNDNPDVKAHFPVEVRFVKKDDIMMTPSGDEDVCFIGIISFRPYSFDAERARWWRFFEDLAFEYGGKPHWAKAHKMTKHYLSKIYKSYDCFMDIRDELDPHMLFVNEYWQRVLLL